MLLVRHIFSSRLFFPHAQNAFSRYFPYYLGVFSFVMLFLFFPTSVSSATTFRHASIIDVPYFSHVSLLQNQDDVFALYVSPAFETKFSFSGIGLRWDGAAPNTHEPNVIFSLSFFDASRKSWSPWYQLDPIGKDTPSFWKSGDFYTRPIFPDFAPQRVRYRIENRDPEHIPNITRVELIYFDTRLDISDISETQSVRPLNDEEKKLKDNLQIISREEWGADESYRLRGDGTEIWPVQTAPLEKFIIHHTAGGNGGDDPAATIRGIYYWHAVVLGWGDIGYNFLIDGQGNIYEGRSGGDAAVGGHTYDDKTNTNYNVGSMGIALLGCFESEEKGCSEPHKLTKLQRKPLTDLIAQKSFDYNIEPLGTSEFYGRDISNIIGHRDVDQTLCPGSRVRSQMDAIATLSASKYKKLARQPYAAKFVSNTIQPATFAGDTHTLRLTFKNMGTEIWKSGNVFLQVYDIHDGVSRYRDSTWRTPLGNFVITKDIAPGEKANVTFQLTSPQEPGLYRNIYKLFHNDALISGGETSSVSRVDAMFRATLVKHTVPRAMLSPWKTQVTLKFRNDGVTTWDKNFVLHAQDLGHQTSQFFHKSWLKSTIVARSLEGSVSPGGTGTFTFVFDAPNEPGLYYNRFFLNAPNPKLVVQDGSLIWVTRVDSES